MSAQKSNRAIGNAFEQELCDLLFERGFWAKNLKQDNAGQPADVIAVRNKIAYLIDCKDCSAKGFDLRRVEDNQVTAMELWEDCGNGQGWFALKASGKIWMMPKFTIMAYMSYQSSISFDEIFRSAKPFEEWVVKCK